MDAVSNEVVKVIRCCYWESGLFYGRECRCVNEVRSGAFSDAVKRWKSEHGVKSLREYVIKNGDLSSFFREPVISGYLSRSKVGVDELGIPVIENKHEGSLYLRKKVQLGGFVHPIPYRGIFSWRECNLNAKVLNALTEKKGKQYLDFMSGFNIQGMRVETIRMVVVANVCRFNELKLGDRDKYKGVHMYGGGGTLSGFIQGIEMGEIVEFDLCSRNIILCTFRDGSHCICCGIVVDTRNKGKAKVESVLSFNSWSGRGLRDSLREEIDRCDEVGPISVVTFYYGAQGGVENAWDEDGNCALYAINTMNSVGKLLIDEGSLFHRCFFNGEVKIEELDVRNRLLVELRRAMPQYFEEKGGEIRRKVFDERKVVHMRDRWLMGSLAVEYRGGMVGVSL